MDVTRKNFLRLVVYVSAAHAIGCAVDDENTKDSTDPGSDTTDPGSDTTDPGSDTTDPGSDTTPTGPFTCSESISLNHGHELMVSDADVQAGVEKVYDITGTSPHSHSFRLTATDFATLAAGGTVMKKSSLNIHDHDITVMCVQ